MARALLIAGPTASGKSALALALARRFGAIVVNADSMQVYRDWRTLTARPSEDEERQAPHALFGCVDGAENFSAGRWLEAAGRALAGAERAILVGGTGLYFKALTEGLSDIPAVPDAVRAKVRAGAQGRDSASLHAELGACDPLTAARLRPSDRQRVLRALEIFAATGVPLALLQGARGAPLLARGEWAGLFLAPERAALNARIDARFDAMIGEGALDEAAKFAARKLDPALPAMRAHGAPHLMGYLRGETNLEAAVARSKLDTRQYAKRQFTWARHQMAGFQWTAPAQAIELGARLLGE